MTSSEIGFIESSFQDDATGWPGTTKVVLGVVSEGL